MDFGTLKGKVFEQLGKPIAENRELAGTSINATINWIQRQRDFNVLRRLVGVTYPADAVTVDIYDLTEKKAKNVLSVQATSDCEPFGQVIEIHSRNYLMRRIKDTQPGYAKWVPFPAMRHGRQTQSGAAVDDYYHAYFVGQTLGLHPVPTKAMELELEFIEWLPELTDDTDTNPFTEFAWDFVLYKTVEVLRTTYAKDKEEDDGYLKNLLQSYWFNLVTWDESLDNHPIEI